MVVDKEDWALEEYKALQMEIVATTKALAQFIRFALLFMAGVMAFLASSLYSEAERFEDVLFLRLR